MEKLKKDEMLKAKGGEETTENDGLTDCDCAAVCVKPHAHRPRHRVL
jgi:hypothetical protein